MSDADEVDRRRKERIDREYRELRAADPDLYRECIAMAENIIGDFDLWGITEDQRLKLGGAIEASLVHVAVWSLPTDDEIGVCEVARDLVAVAAMGGPDRTADAIGLLEQAPNRLARRCPVCGARSGVPCFDLENEKNWGLPGRGLMVPHRARLTAGTALEREA